MLAPFVLAGKARAGLSLPPAYEDLVIAEGLELPTDVAYVPDGRMFVTELTGAVKVVDPDERPLARRLIDISDHVNSYADRGLLGIAADVDFATNGYLYLLYAREDDPDDVAGPKAGRLTRITVRPDNTVENPDAPETELLGSVGAPCPPPANAVDCLPTDGVHTVGDVESAADGTLYVSSGDGLRSLGPRPGVFDTYDEASLSGKILHVDRDGRGVPGHPFCPGDANLDHVCTKLHAVGVRNAYRLTLDRLGRLFTGDVGSMHQEEVDLVSAGTNLGWPCWEGLMRTPAYESDPFCVDFYARVTTTDPIHVYPWDLEGTGATVTLGPLLGGAAYPEAERNWLYFGDYVKGFIHRLRLDGTGQVTAVEPFARGFYGTILEESPDGELVSGSLFEGEIRRVAYAPGNKTPIARASASPQWGDPPLEVSFRGSDSTDPDGDSLDFHWTFGDGAESTQADPVHVYETSGRQVARLVVSDGERSSSHAVAVWPGNSPATVRMTAPASYEGGQALRLEAQADDPEDGALTGAALRWQVLLRHGDHLHHLLTGAGPVARLLIGDDHDADTHLEATVTATDGGGLPVSQSATLRPRTTVVQLDSVPPGAGLTYALTPASGPFSAVTAVGFAPVVTAVEAFTDGGRRYTFERWSNGAPRIQQVRVPSEGLHLTAFYGAEPRAGVLAAEPAAAGLPAVRRAAPAIVGGSTVWITRGRGSVQLRCGPAPCRGRLLAERRVKRRWVALARTAYTLPAGAQRRVRFRLSPYGRRLLERRGRLRVRLRVIEHAPVAAVARVTTLRMTHSRVR